MIAKKIICLIITCLMISHCSFKDDKYKVGQVWYYETRQNEVNSTLTIVSVDNDYEEGVIIGVHLDKIEFTRLENYDEVNINFLPFSKLALDKSVIKIKEYTAELPDFRSEYNAWKQDKDTSINKCFKSPVKQVLDSMEIKALQH
jgi:hypothetical protein